MMEPAGLVMPAADWLDGYLGGWMKTSREGSGPPVCLLS